MSAVTERLQLILSSIGGKAVVGDITGVSTASEGAAVKTTLLQKAQQRLGLEGASTGTILKGAVAGGAVIAGAAIAKFALDGVQQFADLTGGVRAFQRVAGTTAEDSSKIVFAMKELGIAPDIAATSVGRLETRLGTGKAKLEQFGIATKNAKGETLDAATILANVSEAYQNADSQSEKAAIGNEAFGKSWQKMAAFLGKGKDDLKAIYDEAAKDHQVFSQNDLEKGREFTLATTQLKDAWSGLQVELGSAIIPQVTKATEGLTTGIHLADEGAGALGTTVGDLVGTALDAVNPLSGAEKAVGALGDAFGLGGDDAEDFGDKQKKAQDATKNLANAISEHGRNSKEARDAERELSAASKDLKGDQDAVGESVQKVNDNLTTEAQKLYDAATAAQTSAGDHIALDNAVAGVESKFTDLSAAQTDGSTSAFDLSQKQRDLAGQVLSVVSAAEKLAIDALPATATQQDKMNAATDAGATSLQGLYDKFPGLREQVQGYVGDLRSVPPVVATTVIADTAAAHGALDALEQRLSNLVNSTYHVGVSVGKPTDDQYNLAQVLKP